MAWDILIRDGTVIDGSGRPGERADVAIEGGRIAAIEHNGGPTVPRFLVLPMRGNQSLPRPLHISTA